MRDKVSGISRVIAVLALLGFPTAALGGSSPKTTPPAPAARFSSPNVVVAVRHSAYRPLHFFFVAPHGRDRGRCRAAAPCATLYYVSTASCHSGWSVQPGDTVVLLSGTYTATYGAGCDGRTPTGPPIVTWNSTSGSATSPITIDASSATITRASPVSSQAQQLPLVTLVHANYVIWDGGTVIGSKAEAGYNSGLSQSLYGDIDIEGSSTDGIGDVVENASVQHSQLNCIKIEDDESYVTIQNNTVSDCGNSTLEHGIYVSGAHETVTGNTVTGVSGWGMQSYPSSGVTNIDDSFTNNTVSSCGLGGIYSYYGGGVISGNTVSSGCHIEVWANNSNQTVEQNIFLDTWLEIHADATSPGQYLIYNNTFWHGSSTAAISFGGSGSPVGQIENNIFYGTGSNHVSFGGTWAASTLFDYNDYYDILAPASPGSHSLTVDPLFVAPGSDFHLQSSSPALQAGTPVGLSYLPPAPDLGALCFYCLHHARSGIPPYQPAPKIGATTSSAPPSISPKTQFNTIK